MPCFLAGVGGEIGDLHFSLDKKQVYLLADFKIRISGGVVRAHCASFLHTFTF